MDQRDPARMLPKLLLPCLLTIAVAVAGVVCCSCVHEFPSIARDHIPEVILTFADGFVPPGVPIEDMHFVWRVCAPKDGRLLVASTYDSMQGERQPTLFMASFPLDQSGEVGPFDGHAVSAAFDPRRKSQGSFSEGNAVFPDCTVSPKLDAGGVCSDTRLAKVVATTTCGQTVETTPTDGFWFLLIEGIELGETWSRIVGLDVDGKTVADLGRNVLAER